MALIVILILMVVILGIVVIKNPISNTKEPQTITYNNGTDNNNVDDGKTEHNITHSVSEFPIEFLKMENNNENMIYSPLSIKYALKMLEDGAMGNTKEQIRNAIGDTDITKYDNIGEVLSLANAVYIRNEFSEYIKEDYKNTLIERYNAEVIYDPFENANNINNWIEEKTLHIIKNMLKDEDVQNPDIKMILVNALAIDMKWENEFDTAKTGSAPFYKDGKQIEATTMHEKTSSDSAAYYKDDNIIALSMDLEKYEDTQLEFMLVMPETDLDEYINTVTMKDINDIRNKLTLASDTEGGINISIPKFSFNYNLKLKDDLINMGITDAFNVELADFSNMSDEEMSVGDALHKADIEFTEKGVKAAAVTVMIMDANTALPEHQPEQINIDNPFMFLIRDKDTGEIWFVGTVYEPNLWENDKADYQQRVY